VYAEAGLHCATFVLPQKIDGMQQKLFVASPRTTAAMVRLLEMAEQAAAAHDTAQMAAAVSSAAQWAERLQLAIEEIEQLIPAGSTFILVNDDQWAMKPR